MKSFKSLLTKIPFTPNCRKIDPKIKELLSVKRIKKLPLIIIFRYEPDKILLSRINRMGFKVKYNLPFIKALCGIMPARSFDSLSKILEIRKIYYDSKAFIMAEQNDASNTEKAKAKKSRPIKLTGKGVTTAFIDTGIFPHHTFTRPFNRIMAFKDFVNGLDFPYDDNGHGTACIGAGFGREIDSKFLTSAYEANIICAKAFDSLGTGSYSDILAAMQWIVDNKERFDVRIAVLPFGSTCHSVHFDLLSYAAHNLWSNGIFVSTCAGNLGPSESTITSPGICPTCFTTGACSIEELPPKASYFSGRGPINTKADKPDILMPGHKIETLKADTSYNPRNKAYYDFKKADAKAIEVSGTSISSSYTAAAAACILQKNKNLKPDDIKSILKTCAVSLNELKTIQGSGIISVKKLEEI